MFCFIGLKGHSFSKHDGPSGKKKWSLTFLLANIHRVKKSLCYLAKFRASQALPEKHDTFPFLLCKNQVDAAFFC